MQWIVKIVGYIMLFRRSLVKYIAGFQPSHIKRCVLMNTTTWHTYQPYNPNELFTLVAKTHKKPKTTYFIIDIWDAYTSSMRHYFLDHTILRTLLVDRDMCLNTFIMKLELTLHSYSRDFLSLTLVNTNMESHIETDITRKILKYCDTISLPKNATANSLVMLYNHLMRTYQTEYDVQSDVNYFMQIVDFELNETLCIRDDYVMGGE